MSMTNNDDMTFISPWACYKATINTERCRALHMNKNQQEDVHEFLILLLEHFQDELTEIAEVFNLIHVFNIFLQPIITCQECSRIVEERQWYWNLTLHFPRVPHSQELNIYSLLDAYLVLILLVTRPARSVTFLDVLIKRYQCQPTYFLCVFS